MAFLSVATLRRGAIYNGCGGQTVGLAKILDNTRDAKVLTITRNTRDWTFIVYEASEF